MDFVSIVENISNTLAPVQHLIAGFAYIMGIIFVIIGLVKLYKFNNIGGGEEGMSPAMVYVFGGSFLIFLPSTLNALSKTVFGLDNILSYATPNPLDIISSIVLLIQTAGLVFFVRGCVLLITPSQSGGPKDGHRGIGFICAGILAMNFKTTTAVLASIVGDLAATALKFKNLFGF